MGINGFWDVIKDTGVDTSLARWSANHLKERGRPLRIAIDEAHWRYKSITVEAFEEIKRKTPPARPRELNMLDRIWSLIHIGIEIIFVFDGEGRPDAKRGKKTEDSTGRKAREENNDSLKETLTNLHIPWRQAPGEAEAECAALQRLGLVDAVWSEDSDTLMFGCTVLVKNLLKSNGDKSKDEAKVYRLCDIERKTGISTNGIVLYAMVAGCDYTKGLYGCSTAVGRELATKKMLVEEFSKTSANEGGNSWKLWRRRLEAQLSNLSPTLRSHFDKDKSNISQFPDLQALQHCRNPKISSDDELRNLDCIRGDWYKRYSTESLRTTIPYMRDRYHYNKPSRWWFRHLAPVALNQRLLGKESGARDLFRIVKQKRKDTPTSTVEIDPRQVFPGIEQAICRQGMPVLNGILTGKYADRAVVGKPLEMVQSKMLDAVLGWGLSNEEFSEWRKGPKKASAGDGKSASKTGGLPNTKAERRGRKRKTEGSLEVTPPRKQPTRSNPPAEFKTYEDFFSDLDGPPSQEMSSVPVPPGALRAASKPPIPINESTQIRSINRVRDELGSYSAPRSENAVSAPRHTPQTHESMNGVSEVTKNTKKALL